MNVYHTVERKTKGWPSPVSSRQAISLLSLPAKFLGGWYRKAEAQVKTLASSMDRKNKKPVATPGKGLASLGTTE